MILTAGGVKSNKEFFSSLSDNETLSGEASVVFCQREVGTECCVSKGQLSVTDLQTDMDLCEKYASDLVFISNRLWVKKNE